MHTQKKAGFNYTPDTFILDMNKLLDGNEVLSFAVDDYLAEKGGEKHHHHEEQREGRNIFGLITVQAKDLRIYVIDYENNKVVSIASQMFPIVRESIYFHPTKYKKQRAAEGLKIYME